MIDFRRRRSAFDADGWRRHAALPAYRAFRELDRRECGDEAFRRIRTFLLGAGQTRATRRG